MTERVATFDNLAGIPTNKDASTIGSIFTQWDTGRDGWKAEKVELNNFLFATDTRKTSVKSTKWKNSTTLPKLTQIRDNLHANYMSALFPNDDWFEWQAEEEEGADKEKARIIQAYMKNKLRQNDFQTTISKILLDWIDYGNAFGDVVSKFETLKTGDDVTVSGFQGPQLNRLSPADIVFDPRAQRFRDCPNITRMVLSLGDLRKMEKTQTEAGWIDNAITNVLAWRQQITGGGFDSQLKAQAFGIQGFTSVEQYATSGEVELLIFEGDWYNQAEDVLHENQRIIVADRNFIVLQETMKSLLGESSKTHVGWRLRPDNLWAMGPLDNLVGMQYRIDHMENLKADVFDQIAWPPTFQKGHIEDWEWGPNERIYGDEESSIEMLRPDSTALQADFQIGNMMQLMEELAGSPRESMGIRTPGEKTAFEFEGLMNAASRIFQNKIEYFQIVFLEPVLNKMLEAAVRHMTEIELVEVLDDEFGVVEFLSIKPEDLKAKGRLRPVGARHFAEKSKMVQNLDAFVSSPAYADPSVQAHVSGLKLAELYESLIGMKKFGLVTQNIRLIEAQETQSVAQASQDQLTEEAGIDPELPDGGLTDGLEEPIQ
jgi:hypothetical protein